jgi:NADH:ubiquinone oxidoreductase subunit 4 (subunit M)
MITLLITLPFFGIFTILGYVSFKNYNIKLIKIIALAFSVLNFIVSLIIYILYDFSGKEYQYIQEKYEISNYDFFLGLDGLSIYFVLLTTFIMPIAIISN